MNAILLFGIVVLCVLPCLSRPTDCNKAVLDIIAQIRIRLDELEGAHRDILDAHSNKIEYKNATSTILRSSGKLRKHKGRRKHGSHHRKINHKGRGKVLTTAETSATTESTTIDYITEALDVIVTSDLENLTTKLSGGFTDNPTTLSN